MSLRATLRDNPLMLAALAGGAVLIVRAANIYLTADVTMLQAVFAAVGMEPVPESELQQAADTAAKAAGSMTALPVVSYGQGTFPTSEIVGNSAADPPAPPPPVTVPASSEPPPTARKNTFYHPLFRIVQK